MLVGLYARVSTDEQNIKQQVNYLREYCLSKGWKFRSYTDKAFSRRFLDRPAWNKLVKDCNSGKIDVILVNKYDRITSNMRGGLDFLDWLKDSGVTLHSVFDGGDFVFTPDQIFQFKLKLLLAEYELDVKEYRSKIGIERAKKEGKYKGRKKGAKNKNNKLS